MSDSMVPDSQKPPGQPVQKTLTSVGFAPTAASTAASQLQARNPFPPPKPASINKQTKRKADEQLGKREDAILEDLAKASAMIATLTNKVDANTNEMTAMKEGLQRMENEQKVLKDMVNTIGLFLEKHLPKPTSTTEQTATNSATAKPNPTPHPKPQKQATTYAQAAGGMAESSHNPENQPKGTEDWDTAGKKRKQKKQTTKTDTPKPYASTDRRIIVHLGKRPEQPVGGATEDLHRINSALTSIEGFTKPPLALARISTTDDTLTLTTAPYARNTDYEDKLPTIEQAIMDLQPSNSRVMQRWSKFIVHGVPLDVTPEAVRRDIESIYQRPMGQTPRWLINPEKIASGKTASSMVITLVGELTIKDLGVSSLSIANKNCRLEQYIQFNSATHCHNCQGWGHPKEKCRNATKCSHCSGDHHSSKHPCSTDGCRGGLRCAHPPMICANCHAPHKATDSACPTKAIALAARRKNPQTNETEITTENEIQMNDE
jgi:hypothetical protein